MANQIIGFEPEPMEQIAAQTAGIPRGFCIDTDHTLDEINRHIIRQVLTECHGNQSAAAKRLGISRTTLWRMLKQ